MELIHTMVFLRRIERFTPLRTLRFLKPTKNFVNPTKNLGDMMVIIVISLMEVHSRERTVNNVSILLARRPHRRQ